MNKKKVSKSRKDNSKNSFNRNLIIGVVVVLVLILGVYFGSSITGNATNDQEVDSTEAGCHKDCLVESYSEYKSCFDQCVSDREPGWLARLFGWGVDENNDGSVFDEGLAVAGIGADSDDFCSAFDSDCCVEEGDILLGSETSCGEGYSCDSTGFCMPDTETTGGMDCNPACDADEECMAGVCMWVDPCRELNEGDSCTAEDGDSGFCTTGYCDTTIRDDNPMYCLLDEDSDGTYDNFGMDCETDRMNYKRCLDDGTCGYVACDSSGDEGYLCDDEKICNYYDTPPAGYFCENVCNGFSDGDSCEHSSGDTAICLSGRCSLRISCTSDSPCRLLEYKGRAGFCDADNFCAVCGAQLGGSSNSCDSPDICNGGRCI